MAQCSAYIVCWDRDVEQVLPKKRSHSRLRHKKMSASERPSGRMYFGEAIVPVSWFAEQVDSVLRRDPATPGASSSQSSSWRRPDSNRPVSKFSYSTSGSPHRRIFPFLRVRRCPRSATLEMLITWRFFRPLEKVTVIMRPPSWTRSLQRHHRRVIWGDHLSVAVIHRQWNYTKKSEQQPSPLVDPKCMVQLECKSMQNENLC